MKLTVKRPDGATVDMEGTAQECVQALQALFPPVFTLQPQPQPWVPTIYPPVPIVPTQPYIGDPPGGLPPNGTQPWPGTCPWPDGTIIYTNICSAEQGNKPSPSFKVEDGGKLRELDFWEALQSAGVRCINNNSQVATEVPPPADGTVRVSTNDFDKGYMDIPISCFTPEVGHGG